MLCLLARATNRVVVLGPLDLVLGIGLLGVGLDAIFARLLTAAMAESSATGVVGFGVG
jgi:hypothetical protein